MNNHEPMHNENHQAGAATQAELYESLRRIGELEDQKNSVQAEIDRRTAELRHALQHIDRDSLLFRMLATALNADASSPSVAGTGSKRRSSKRASRKNTAKARG